MGNWMRANQKSRQRILNFLRKSRRNRMKLNWRSQQRILILPKSQRNWRRVNQRSQRWSLIPLRKSQRTCTKLNRRRFLRILNFLKNQRNRMKPNLKTQHKLNSQRKKQRNQKSQRFFSRTCWQSSVKHGLTYEELRMFENTLAFLRFPINHHPRSNVSFPCEVKCSD